jgi:hypothetical protein
MSTAKTAEPVPDAFRDLLDALRAESAALVSNDLVALEVAVERKRQLLLLLAPHARHLGRPGADAAAQELAARAAQLNATNAKVLQARQATVRGRLDALRGPAPASTYTNQPN